MVSRDQYFQQIILTVLPRVQARPEYAIPSLARMLPLSALAFFSD
jgi:hypothetical protein